MNSTGVTVRKRPILLKISDFLSSMTLKFDRWPWKTIEHLFCATSSYVHHFVALCEFKLELCSGKAPIGAKFALTCDLDLWPLTLTFCIDIMIVNGNNSWKFHDDTMTEILWKKCDGWTNRQTDRSVLRANWLQLKISWMSHLIHRTIRIGVI